MPGSGRTRPFPDIRISDKTHERSRWIALHCDMIAYKPRYCSNPFRQNEGNFNQYLKPIRANDTIFARIKFVFLKFFQPENSIDPSGKLSLLDMTPLIFDVSGTGSRHFHLANSPVLCRFLLFFFHFCPSQPAIDCRQYGLDSRN